MVTEPVRPMDGQQTLKPLNGTEEKSGQEEETMCMPCGEGLSQGRAAEEEKDEKEQDDIEEEEETRTPVKARTPHRVSQKEREDHEILHTPYREWCKYCVRARAKNSQHRAQSKGDKNTEVPRISIDSFFMRK